MKFGIVTFHQAYNCGVAPKEFDVAASPRKELSEVFVVHGRSRRVS